MSDLLIGAIVLYVFYSVFFFAVYASFSETIFYPNWVKNKKISLVGHVLFIIALIPAYIFTGVIYVLIYLFYVLDLVLSKIVYKK